MVEIDGVVSVLDYVDDEWFSLIVVFYVGMEVLYVDIRGGRIWILFCCWMIIYVIVKLDLIL